MEFIDNLLHMVLSAAPWLFFGLLISGLIKAWVPDNFISQQLGNQRTTTLLKASLIGAPIPLCSCSVIPVAMSLRRGGASKGATASFLVATPETGVDSLSVSYALLGPVMMLARLISSISSAVIVGMMVAFSVRHERVDAPDKSGTSETTSNDLHEDNNQSERSCCTHSQQQPKISQEAPTGDVKSGCCGSSEQVEQTQSGLSKTVDGIAYAFSRVIDDMVIWLSIGLLCAAAITTWIPPQFLADWGGGLLTMVVILLISIPMYICATASTPLAAGLMLAGLSPGAALVFLLAGPATNMTTLGVLKSELGKRAMLAYWVGIALSTLGFGLLLDLLLGASSIQINIADHLHEEMIPLWLSGTTSLLLIFAAIKPLRVKLIGR